MPQTVQKVTKEENARENKDEEKTTDKETKFPLKSALLIKYFPEDCIRMCTTLLALYQIKAKSLLLVQF